MRSQVRILSITPYKAIYLLAISADTIAFFFLSWRYMAIQAALPMLILILPTLNARAITTLDKLPTHNDLPRSKYRNIHRGAAKGVV
jgi:hypothetical protein